MYENDPWIINKIELPVIVNLKTFITTTYL